MENYYIENVPTESANRGVLLYIKKAINYKLRPDLMIYKKRELESVFIEIIQRNSKTSLKKWISENEEVILPGDFNIDLLKCDSNNNVSDFLDIIYSTNILPNITSPTRLTSCSQTLTDNFFSSVVNDGWLQGILFPQYLTTKQNF